MVSRQRNEILIPIDESMRAVSILHSFDACKQFRTFAVLCDCFQNRSAQIRENGQLVQMLRVSG